MWSFVFVNTKDHIWGGRQLNVVFVVIVLATKQNFQNIFQLFSLSISLVVFHASTSHCNTAEPQKAA